MCSQSPLFSHFNYLDTNLVVQCPAHSLQLNISRTITGLHLTIKQWQCFTDLNKKMCTVRFYVLDGMRLLSFANTAKLFVSGHCMLFADCDNRP